MTNPNLPKGIEHRRAKKKNYKKMSEFKTGENRFRIVITPIGGYQDWKDNKPIRFRYEDEPKRSIDPEKPHKEFWSLYIWDYEIKDLFILEVAQSGVISQLEAIITQEDWGDSTQYDIKVLKEGSGINSRYTLTPCPPKPMNEEIKKALKDAPVRLEALYDSGDPWRDLDEPEEYKTHSVPSIDQLAKILTDSIVVAEPERVIEYLEFCETKISKPIDEAVEVWLGRPKEFAAAYEKWLGNNKEKSA